MPSPAPLDAIVRDEGRNRLHRLTLSEEGSFAWSVDTPPGRNLQRIEGDRFLIGTDTGWHERSIVDGSLLTQVDRFPGTLTATRLSNGNTLLSGLDWPDRPGVSLLEVNSAVEIVKTIQYPNFNYARLITPTARGSYWVTSNRQIFEGSEEGSILRTLTPPSPIRDPHIWKVLVAPDESLWVCTGYAATLVQYSPFGELIRVVTAPEAVRPYFFSDLRLRPNGNLLVVNWQGHGTDQGALGHQILEFSPFGDLIWSWQQPAPLLSSLQAALVLEAE